MEASEEYVRARWEHVTYADTALGVLAGAHYVIIAAEDRRQIFAAYRHTASEAWSAARAFTENREREIAEVEEEIDSITRNRKARSDER